MDIFKTLGIVLAVGVAGWFVYSNVIKPKQNPQNLQQTQQQIYDKSVEYLMKHKYNANYGYYY
jgi:hypothetical protein